MKFYKGTCTRRTEYREHPGNSFYMQKHYTNPVGNSAAHSQLLAGIPAMDTSQ